MKRRDPALHMRPSGNTSAKSFSPPQHPQQQPRIVNKHLNIGRVKRVRLHSAPNLNLANLGPLNHPRVTFFFFSDKTHLGIGESFLQKPSDL